MTIRLSPRFLRRDFSRLPTTGPISYQAKSYSKMSQGGPKACELVGSGDEAAAWAAVEWLRYGVEIRDEHQTPVWWGMVNGVDLTAGRYTFGVTLDTMANRVAVAYARIVPGETGTDRGTTTWIEDAESALTYGVKEALISFGNLTDDAAEKLRGAALDLGRRPVPTVALSQQEGEAQVTLHCVGWWETLGWKRYFAASDMIGHLSADSTRLIKIIPSGAGMLAQSFLASGAWRPTTVKVKLKKIGSPTRDVVLDLCENAAPAGAASLPGRKLLSVAIPASILETTSSWEVGEWPANITFVPGRAYWLLIRLGAPPPATSTVWDANNYYEVEADPGNEVPTGSVVYLPNAAGSSWQSASDQDLFFFIGGVRDTTELIRTVYNAGNQFLTGLEMRFTTGVYTISFANGDTTALAELKDLLDLGSVNSTRLLATVDSDRRLILTEEPPRPGPGERTLTMDDQGIIYTPSGVAQPPHLCISGNWVRLRDVPSILTIADPSLGFIEDGDYDAETGIYTPHFRGTPTVWDITNLG